MAMCTHGGALRGFLMKPLALRLSRARGALARSGLLTFLFAPPRSKKEIHRAVENFLCVCARMAEPACLRRLPAPDQPGRERGQVKTDFLDCTYVYRRGTRRCRPKAIRTGTHGLLRSRSAMPLVNVP